MTRPQGTPGTLPKSLGVSCEALQGTGGDLATWTLVFPSHLYVSPISDDPRRRLQPRRGLIGSQPPSNDATTTRPCHLVVVRHCRLSGDPPDP